MLWEGDTDLSRRVALCAPALLLLGLPSAYIGFPKHSPLEVRRYQQKGQGLSCINPLVTASVEGGSATGTESMGGRTIGRSAVFTKRSLAFHQALIYCPRQPVEIKTEAAQIQHPPSHQPGAKQNATISYANRMDAIVLFKQMLELPIVCQMEWA